MFVFSFVLFGFWLQFMLFMHSVGVAVLIESSFALSPLYRCALLAVVWYLTIEIHTHIFKTWMVDTSPSLSRLNYNIAYPPNTKMYDNNQIIKLSLSMLRTHIVHCIIYRDHKTLNALNIIWYIVLIFSISLSFVFCAVKWLGVDSNNNYYYYIICISSNVWY